MDNAAKALLIAAEILIAILIITLGVYAFVYYKDVAVSYDKSQVELEVQKFNNQFTKYLGEEVTPQKIVTLANLSRENGYEIVIEIEDVHDLGGYIHGRENFQNYGEEGLISFLQNMR